MADLPALLVFIRSTTDGLPARLVFGDESGPGERVTLHSSARLSGLRGFVRGRVGVVVHSGAKLSGLRGYVRAVYDVNVERPYVVQVREQIQSAIRVNVPATDRWQDSRAIHVHMQQAVQQAARMESLQEQRWQDTSSLHVAVAQHAQQAQTIVSATDQSFQDANALHIAAVHRTQQADRLEASISAAFEDAAQLRVATQARQQQAVQTQTLVSHKGSAALSLRLYHVERTQQATRPGVGVRGVVPPKPPLPCHPNLHAQLIFKQLIGAPLPASLVFTCCDRTEPELPPAKIVVPVRKAYIVLNSITLRRVDTGVPLLAHGFSMQLDYRSWTWMWSAELHESAQPHLGRGADGYPAELEAKVNGVPVRLRLTQRAVNQPFMPKRIRVGGKGKNAVLGEPYAPEQTFGSAQDRTAQQLMSDALTVNGVPLGWNIDWGIDDWVVPGDTWSLQGRYMDAVQDIASAVGAYIQPHNTDATLRVLPEYPVAPWQWADVTPDYELPAGVAAVVDHDLQDRPKYNAVWVSGVKSGSVSGPFGRQGTAKDQYAPQVVHALITSSVAHRQRGLAVISNTGSPEQVTLSMQVLPETGLILPGKFVRYAGVTGLVRSTSVQWSRPTLRQQLVLETHPNA